MLLFGGCSSGFGPCPQGDLWSFDPATRIWHEVIVPENPTPRSNPAFVADTAGGRALLLGGLTDGGYAADLWALTLGEYTLWQTITFAGEWPAARASHDTVYTDGQLYLFGGTSAEGAFGDLWTLSFP